MSERVLIYTAICGGYDELIAQPPQTIACDFVCFTDEPARQTASPWRVLPLPPMPGSARARARLPKIVPRTVIGEAGLDELYDFTIWIDGSIRILRSTFAERFVVAARATGLALIPHPERDCIYDEAPASLGRATAHKYRGERLEDQVAHYRDAGYPSHRGLFATGVVARDMRNAAVPAVDDAWWQEIARWSQQDQLSLPFVLWKTGAGHGLVDVHLWKNPLFEVRPHGDVVNGDLLRRARPEFTAAPFVATPLGDAVGVYVAASGAWHLHSPDGGAESFAFGPAEYALIPICGDWDGDGVDSPGVYDPRTGAFYLKNSCGAGDADVVFSFGPPGALPIAGDWDGDGRDSVGIFLPHAGAWALTNRHASGDAEIEFSFGPAPTTMLPVAGDWDGRGRDRVGLYDPAHGTWFLAHDLTTAAPADTIAFGPVGGRPVAGDWNGDGADEIGVYVPEQGRVFLADRGRCLEQLLDPPEATAIAGRWPREQRYIRRS